MKKPMLATYATNRGLGMITSDDIKKLDILYVAFGVIRNDKLTIEEMTNMDVVRKVRAQKPEIKIILSIGGGAEGGFSENTDTDEHISALVADAVKVVKEYDLDGIDIDWEFPTINGDMGEKQQHTNLIKKLRTELDAIDENRKYYVTIAAGSKSWYFTITDLSQSVEYLDYVNLMTYDMSAANEYTVHHSCPYPMNTDKVEEGSIKENIDVFVKNGVPREKLIVGAAFYGRQWKGVKNENNGLYAFAGTPSDYAPGFSQIKRELENKAGFTRYWDDAAKAPYLFDGSTFVTYDDEESLDYKCKLVCDEEIAGVMIWEYSCDEDHVLIPIMDDCLKKYSK